MSEQMQEDSPEQTNALLFTSQSASEHVREDALKRANAMLFLIASRIDRLSESLEVEELSPMARETLLIKYLALCNRLLDTRQQFVSEADETGDFIKMFVNGGFVRKR